LLFFCVCFSPASALSRPLKQPLDKHTIHIELDLDARTIKGTDQITFNSAASEELVLVIGPGVEVSAVKLKKGQKSLSFHIRDFTPNGQDGALNLLVLDPGQNPGAIEISFTANLSPIEAATQKIERGVSFSGIAVMGAEGAFLPSSAFWFPRRLDPLALYDVTIILPPGVLAVMEGELISEKKRRNKTLQRYKTHNPMDGINISAGRYSVRSERYKDVDIKTYFYRDDPGLSNIYINKTKEYIDIYEGLLPVYPYRKFAVVENFLPTGFGMPSFTLLGSLVLRLPFIPDTALGHEFAHNWWGNGVFIDASQGNWAESLTSYMADHLFKERVSSKEAALYRLKALTNYANYARKSRWPVSSFRFGSSPEERALGYSKAMMVFHMLRLLVGDALFYESLSSFYEEYAFKKASWNDISSSFEKVTGKELGWFFDQWLLRAGGPELSVKDIEVKEMLTSLSTSAPAYRLGFKILQREPLYELKIPVLIETEAGEERRDIFVDRSESEFTLELNEKPKSIEIDPDSSIFRVLAAQETPASLASLLGDARTLLVMPGEAASRERYMPAIRSIQRDFHLSVIEDIAALRGEAGSAPLFIFGGPGENALFYSLEDSLSDSVRVDDGKISANNGSFEFSDTAVVLATRITLPLEGQETAPRLVGLFLGGLEATEMELIAGRVSHLTSKGFLIFSGGGALQSGQNSGDSLLRFEVGP
jgi:aminopeptidase N